MRSIDACIKNCDRLSGTSIASAPRLIGIDDHRRIVKCQFKGNVLFNARNIGVREQCRQTRLIGLKRYIRRLTIGFGGLGPAMMTLDKILLLR